MAEQLSQGVAKMTLSDREERVTQKQLNILAAKLGADWENLAIVELGLSDAEVHECKANNILNVRSQKFDMLMKWKAKAGKDATVAKLVQKLRNFGIDEDKFDFLQPPKEQTDTSESGLVTALQPVGPERTAPISVDLRLIQLWRLASAIVQKTNPGVDFTPDPKGGKKEEERLQKIKQWEASLTKRVEEKVVVKNYSGSINYSIDYEDHSATTDYMKSVCLIEYPNGNGSGFLIGPRHVITANHVWAEAYKSVGQVTNPQRFLVRFQLPGAKWLTFTFKPDNIVARDDNLDYAIFEIHPVSSTDHSVVSEVMKAEGICPLGTKIVASVGSEDIVVIVGHPGGGRKRVDHCAVVGVDDVTNQALLVLGYPDNPQSWPQERPDMGSYHTSVMFEGSSGSPCFTKHGNVVFMHIHGFHPYNDKPSLVEMGVVLSTVKMHAQGILPSDVFSEIFGS